MDGTGLGEGLKPANYPCGNKRHIPFFTNSIAESVSGSRSLWSHTLPETRDSEGETRVNSPIFSHASREKESGKFQFLSQQGSQEHRESKPYEFVWIL